MKYSEDNSSMSDHVQAKTSQNIEDYALGQAQEESEIESTDVPENHLKSRNLQIPTVKKVNEEIACDQNVDEKMKQFQDTFDKLTTFKDTLYKDIEHVSAAETSTLPSEEEPSSRVDMVKTLIDNFFDKITNQEVTSALQEMENIQQNGIKTEVKGMED